MTDWHDGMESVDPEFAEIAALLGDDYRAACHDAAVPSSGLVWWRATVRARAEAARAAERPISLFEAVAAAAGIGLGCGLLGGAVSPVGLLTRAGALIARLDAGRDQLASLTWVVAQHAFPFVLALGVCLVVAPLALFFAFSDD